jgi:peptidoglycan/LPS O-acetylase OafA/YrhL
MGRIRWRLRAKDALVAGAVASLTSGVPSTILSLWRGHDPLEPSLAAGTLLLPQERRRHRLLAAAALVHAALSLGWAMVLTATLPRRATVRWSVLAGLAIALVDLGVIGRRFDRIRALPPLPQLADHLAYALTVGIVLVARRNPRPPSAR